MKIDVLSALKQAEQALTKANSKWGKHLEVLEEREESSRAAGPSAAAKSVNLEDR